MDASNIIFSFNLSKNLVKKIQNLQNIKKAKYLD